jgi:phosphomannomutase
MSQIESQPPVITAEPPDVGEAPADVPSDAAPTVGERLAAAAGPMFQCPGEPQPVSRAVHLSRLASFYAKCRSCEHGHDPAASSRGEIDADGSSTAASGSRDVFQREGVRGTYLTVLGRPQAETLAAAFAGAVWERFPLRGRGDDDLPAVAKRVAPVIAVGRDAAAPSADIACGVVRGLRRMGCHVVELGPTTRPALDFAVYHLRADGGVQVTGAGSARAATGLDFVDRDGVPWSQPGMLGRVQQLSREPPRRPTRTGGDLRSFDVDPPLRAEFQRFGHGLRQLRIGVAAECAVQSAKLVTWCGDWPATLVPLEPLPEVRDDDTSRDLRRQLRATLHECELQWIARVGGDGRQVQLLDERCRPVDPAVWLVRVTEQEASTGTPFRCVVGEGVPALTRGRLKALGGEVIAVDGTHEAIVRRMTETQAQLAADGAGRIWFADHYPVCDGLVTLSRLARLASRSGQAVSHWAT